VLDFIYYPVSAILWFWHKVFGAVPFLGPDNGITWSLAVMFLVFTLRALLFKPFVSQVRSMRKMQEFAPEIRKLQEKHKGDRQRLAQEMQKLQSEHGVNPLGGCLPILIQIPVFIGLFQVLKEFKKEKTSNYVFGADEVQSFVNADLFGTKLSAYITMAQNQLTDLDTTRVATALVAIPLMIAASIATHVTARHSVERQSAAAAANPQAAIMNKVTLYLFPIGVLVGGPFFPVAILIYWLSNNVWTLGQQWLVYRRIDQEELDKKEQATVQRQALAPRPGQKPATPTKGKRPSAPAENGSAGESSSGRTPADDSMVDDSAAETPSTTAPSNAAPSTAGEASTAGGDGASTGASAVDAGGASSNGSQPANRKAKPARPTDSAALASGEPRGQKRSRARKSSRKRR
jgi:YidC/Oxa1 family membrane protein insertase